MIEEKPKIRRAKRKDLPKIIELGIGLGKQHLNYDTQRFNLINFEPIQETYANFFAKQLRNKKAIILVAELGETIVGYAFIRFEPDNLGDLLKESAWLHDIYFEKTARDKGIGKQFFVEIIKAAKSLGSESLMLTVSSQNETAKRFFEQRGFRPTMQEMRLDFEIEE
jgi:diamine N-acetyltransferase